MNPFNFFEALNGREIFYWLGTPCFISVNYTESDSGMVQITTYDGQVYDDIPINDLESPDPEEMLFV